MNIQFNHDSLKTVNQRDLMNFISHILNEHVLPPAISLTHENRVYVNTSSLEQCDALNCRVTIKFQVWKKDEKGHGTILYWVCHRANDFCCSQQRVQSFPPMPIEQK